MDLLVTQVYLEIDSKKTKQNTPNSWSTYEFCVLHIGKNFLVLLKLCLTSMHIQNPCFTQKKKSSVILVSCFLRPFLGKTTSKPFFNVEES